MVQKSHPARGVWIEMTDTGLFEIVEVGSHPARGVWIEIILIEYIDVTKRVAPRKGCVD